MESSWWPKVLRALGCETKHFDLVSAQRRDDCVRLLLVNTDSEWALLGSHPVAGRVYDTTFSLRSRSSYNIRLQTIVRGEFIEELRQTRLACWSGPRLGLHTVPIVAAMLAGTAFVFGLPVSLLMFALGIALARFERFQARNDERFLIKFLIKTLDAREVP